MSLETPLAKVRGLGPSGEGGEHWWDERVSALASLLLGLWLLASLIRLPDLAQTTIREWLSMPSAAVPMLFFVAVAFWHGALGLRVVVEDYVHEPGNKFLALLLLRLAAWGGAGLAGFAVLKVALGPAG